MASTRRSSKLTEGQGKYVDARMEGQNQTQAAETAGLSNGTKVERSKTVQQALAEARAELEDITTIRRVDVINGIMESIGVARMQADAGNMRQGWTEIAKILGHYAPEVKRVELTTTESHLNQKLRNMPLDELLRLASGQIVVDGEYREV